MKNLITSFFIGKNQNIALILAFFCYALLFGQVSLAWANNQAEHNNELLVKFKNEKKYQVLKTGKDFSMIINQLQNNPEVENVEPNYTYQASIIPSDTYFNNQWYLKKIKAVEAWDIVRESPEIVIAIIDSGIQINHPDLKENIWRNSREIPDNEIDDDKNGYVDDVYGWDFVDDSNEPTPKFSPGYTQDGILHGTIVAGVAAGYGNNGTGISGITWQAKIMPLKVLGDDGSGDTDDVIKAVDYAIQNGADIINFSFVGFGFSLNLEEAIRRAHQAGVVIVAAAGNEQGDGLELDLDKTPIYPACHDGSDGENMVIGVSATDAIDQKAEFSGFGYKCVDIAAPGVSIFSTSVFAPEKNNTENKFSKYYDGYWAGTSMATPMVSATVALVSTANPGLNAAELKDNILSTTNNISRLNPGYLGKLGAGRLNVYSAVSKAHSKLKSQISYLLLAPRDKKTSEVRMTSKKGEEKLKYLAYEESFLGGVNLAAGDVDGDGIEEIIAGAGPGGGPHIRVFDLEGKVKGQFFAYNPGFRGGVNVAAGDVDGDGIEEIIAGAGPGGGPQVRIFRLSGFVEGQFFAYDKNFQGGVDIATGDTDQDGVMEIITGAGPGGAPHVRVFEADKTLINSFYGLEKDFESGINVGSINIKLNI